MSLLALVLLAFALSLDAFAVAAAAGARARGLSFLQGLRMALVFGFFQFSMPLLGFGLGRSVSRLIDQWDHWIAFALLAGVAAVMIKESFNKKGCEDGAPARGGEGGTFALLALGVATSIDALAVGLSFSLVRPPVSVWAACVLIGVVCAGVSALGAHLGGLLARACVIAKRAELVGGLVLLGIGVKILCEHGMF